MVAHIAAAKDTSQQSVRLITVMTATVPILMVAHASEDSFGRWPTAWSMPHQQAPTSCTSPS
jgi:hypothetical protein